MIMDRMLENSLHHPGLPDFICGNVGSCEKDFDGNAYEGMDCTFGGSGNDTHCKHYGVCRSCSSYQTTAARGGSLMLPRLYFLQAMERARATPSACVAVGFALP